MLFDVFIQNKFYKTISAANAGKVQLIVAKDIKLGVIPKFDPSKKHDIEIVPKNVTE